MSLPLNISFLAEVILVPFMELSSSDNREVYIGKLRIVGFIENFGPSDIVLMTISSDWVSVQFITHFSSPKISDCC